MAYDCGAVGIPDHAALAQRHVLKEIKSMTPRRPGIVKTATRAEIVFCQGRESGAEGRSRPCLRGAAPVCDWRNPPFEDGFRHGQAVQEVQLVAHRL